MKKSNFLRSSKDMLTKSFNSAKCKTSLKLASSRLKLLRNKKEVQVKQMKRELAQLLDSGQDRTARIRVEHVVREEKLMAAYDLLEIYCELIVARLPIIESQKNCPIDLKEAITSVVFASPRCGDIPELVDVRKHLTTKYGKEFISGAVELRPDCGVSRMLVEKLSAKAPDGQTKMKILGAIAEEHGIKWDPKSVEEVESVPPNDLLNGPGSLQNSSYIHEHPPLFEASEQNARSSAGTENSVSAHGGGRGTAPSSNYYYGVSPSGFRDERSEVGQSFSGEGNFSAGRENWNMEFKDATSAAQAAAESAERASLAARAAAQLSRVSRQYSSESQRSEVQSASIHEHFPKDSATSSLPDRSPRFQNERIDASRHDNLARATSQFHDDSHGTSGGGGLGNYGTSSIHEQFPKDSATSSSPDRDSRFQNERTGGSQHDNLTRATRHYSDNRGTSGGGGPGSYGTSSIHEQFPKDSAISSSPDRNSKFQNERTGGLQHDNLTRATRHHNDSHGTADGPRSLVSSGATGSINNNSFASLEKGDRYMQNSFSKEDSREKKIMGKPSGKTEAESMSSSESESTEYVNYFGEETTTKEPKFYSADSHLSTSTFGENIPHSRHQSFGYEATNDPFNGAYKGHVPSETVNKNSHNSASVAFDDSGSEFDDDVIKFDSDPVYDDQQAKLFFPSPERKTPSYDSAIKTSWSFDSDKTLEKSPLASEIFVERPSSQPSENLAAPGYNSRPENVVPTFDDSESDSEMVHHPIGRSKVFPNASSERSRNTDSSRSSNMESVSGTDGMKWLHSSDKTVSDDVHRHGKSEPISSSSEDEAKHTKSQDGKEEFTFGKLTGGLKHKGHIPPPYTRCQLNSVEKAKESPAERSQAGSPPKSSAGLGMRMKTDSNSNSNSRLEDSHSASDADSSEEEFPRETSSYGQRTYAQKTGSEVNTKYAGLRGSTPTSFFDSDSSDSEVGPKKQSLAGRNQLGSGFSRRTKASSSSLETKSSPKYKISSEATVNSDSGVDRKPNRNSFAAKTQESQKPLMNSYVADKQESQTQTRKVYGSETNQAPSDKRMSTEQPRAGLAALKPTAAPKVTSHEGNRKSARAEQPSSSGQIAAASGSNDAPKAPASSGDKFAREDSMKKASHVHPKLPDYDDIAARLQSLRTNRK